MPVCMLPNSEGFLAVVPDVQLEDCTNGYVAVTVQDYDFMMSYTQVTGAEITEAFGFGFAAVFTVGYLSTYAVKAALKLIRLI